MEKVAQKPLKWKELEAQLDGELHIDMATRIRYATDASVYRKLPAAVVIPKNDEDLKAIIRFANSRQMPIIPRTAGTSLAGQCVGEGLVVDFSPHFTRVLEVNTKEKWVKLQPGVIRDELNRELAKAGLFFAPNTSTSSRCMVGGMVGNNSCGTTSIKYGTTRDKVIALEVLLSDGSRATLSAKSPEEVAAICRGNNREAGIYRGIIEMLTPEDVRFEIEAQFPKKSIHRRNTGYALDALLDLKPFAPNGPDLNLAKLIAGSEGTLCVITAITLQLDDLPPPCQAVVCGHFASLTEAMKATVITMGKAPYACELMDKTILDCTRDNPGQAENRFFITGDPAAILAIEVRSDSDAGLAEKTDELIASLKTAGFGYDFPVVYPPDAERVWTLRAAGLGVLSNMKSAAKPIAFVEDTAVDLNDLPAYITDFESMMAGFGQSAVYYAHAGAGELHIRPVLDLKTEEGQEQFHKIGAASAKLVKQYKGSLSGEHGDGRVRAEFIPEMVGEKNYVLFKSVKSLWDPNGLLNPGKIVDAPPMKSDLRYTAGQPPFKWPTTLKFPDHQNMLQMAEACNGSGDCRKLHTTGATMCPSYQATRNEKDSTRARANTIREVLTHPHNPAYPFDSEEIHEVLDLCLSCKACAKECPSSVDMAMLKAEATYQYQLRHGVPLSTKFFGHFHKLAALTSPVAGLANGILGIAAVQTIFKTQIGIAKQRSIPQFSRRKATSLIKNSTSRAKAEIVLYIDEFSQFQDAGVAQKASEVFHELGFSYHAVYLPSARAYLSKGMLNQAREVAEATLKKLAWAIAKKLPIVGIEPSALLGFRDEFPKLVSASYRTLAAELVLLAVTFEEFISQQIVAGSVSSGSFTDEAREVHLHLHCHQKALSQTRHSTSVLGLPANYRVTVIPSGCCGMAGSFGYEKKHFDLSMDIGELVLFPHLRRLEQDIIIAAAGTSCRHQIKDGVQKSALHPAEILAEALRKNA